MNSVILSISIFTLLIAFFISKGVSRIVVGIYFLMFLCSFMLSILLNDGFFLSDNLIEMSFFSFSIYLIVLPFLYIRTDKISTIVVPSLNFLRCLEFLLIVASFVAIYYFVGVAYKVLSLEDLSNFRNNLVVYGHPVITPSLLNTFSGVVATFYLLPMYLFFISLSQARNKMISFFLFLSSLSYPFFVLAYFGRDGIVFWLLSFFTFFILFRRFIETKRLMPIYISFFVIFISGSIFFIFISFARFGDISGVLISVLDYLGQQPKISVRISELDLSFFYGSNSFPLIAKIIGFDPDILKNNLAKELGADNIHYSWMFGTMVKGFVLDFGLLGTLVFLCCFCIISICYFKVRSSSFGFMKTFLLLAYSQIVIQGVFYFRQNNDSGNLYLLILILMLFLSPFLKGTHHLEIKR